MSLGYGFLTDAIIILLNINLCVGIDDGHNIDQEMLKGIYDRVKKKPFLPGEDHTTTVQKVEQGIVGNRPVSGKSPKIFFNLTYSRGVKFGKLCKGSAL